VPELGLALAERTQDAVLWMAASGITDRHGRFKVGEPVDIQVRWDDSKREMLDAQGNKIAVDAAAIVDRVITVGSRLWLGTLADYVGTGSGTGSSQVNPGDVSPVMEVKAFNHVRDLKGRDSFMTVGLVRYHNPGNT
jgi:hypothetical protein